MVSPCITTGLVGVSYNMMNISNARECYVENNSLAETIIYSIYALASFVFGIVGNTVVVLATLKYTVFSLDSITMVFVRHLAIADALYIIVRILPSITVHFMRGWVLGKWLCYFLANLVTITSLASMHFILTISIHRLLRCMFPLRFSLSVRNNATVLALILWGYSTIGTVISLAMRLNVYFRPVIAACDIDYTNKPYIAAAGVVLQMLIPFFCIVFLNLTMYIIAKQRFKDVSNNHALMTVAAVSGLFMVSWLPSILAIFLGVAAIDSTKTIWLDKLQINFYFLSVFGNPIIYSLVHKGFGKFAKSKFSILLRRCHNSVEAQWQNSVSKSSEPAEVQVDQVEEKNPDTGKKFGRRNSKNTPKDSGLKRGSRDVINEVCSKETEPVDTDNKDIKDNNAKVDNGSSSKDSGLYSSGV